jgi:DNA (cytosine-5)-methyltransferase 1
MGARILNLNQPMDSYDIDADACATAEAAGFPRTRASVTDLDPDSLCGITGAIITPPCPSFSKSGKQTGLKEVDYRAILDAIARLGDSQAGMGADDAWTAVRRTVKDPRSALVVEALRFALRLPHVQVVVCEQVPTVAPIWQEMAAELAMAHDFEQCAVVDVASEDLGVASRRTRSFLLAIRHHTHHLGDLPARSWWTCGRFQVPRHEINLTARTVRGPSMAQVLGWPAGERVNTRGNRRTSGGNEFSADGPAWCLTGKARTWKRVSDGATLSAAEAGMLVGFPADYPWQGSRTAQFQRIADVVSPVVAAAVLGVALDLEWQEPVRGYLAGIYPASRPESTPHQPSLFEEVAA